MKAVIFGHESRRPLGETLRASLASEGFDVEYEVQTDPPQRSSQQATFRRALGRLGGEAGMVLEDDVELRHPRVLRESWGQMRHLTVLCLVQPNCHPTALRRVLSTRPRPPVAPRVTRLGRPGKWGGSQALFFPAGWAAELLRWSGGAPSHGRAHGGMSSDTLTKRWFRANDLRVDVLLPNPFQHLSPKSVISNRSRAEPLRSEAVDLDVRW